jgi:hypothetical protein
MAELKSGSFTNAAVAEPDTQVMSSPALVTCETPESDLQCFIQENCLQKWLDVTFRLIARYFSPARGIRLQKKEDTELSDECVSVRVVVGGAIGPILDAYDAFTLEIVSAIPAEAGRKVRLSLGVG